jgi:phytoene desaturase
MSDPSLLVTNPTRSDAGAGPEQTCCPDTEPGRDLDWPPSARVTAEVVRVLGDRGAVGFGDGIEVDM